MVYLLLYALCEISSGCKSHINGFYSNEKECLSSKTEEENFFAKNNSKSTGGFACVKIRGFEK